MNAIAATQTGDAAAVVIFGRDGTGQPHASSFVESEVPLTLRAGTLLRFAAFSKGEAQRTDVPEGKKVLRQAFRRLGQELPEPLVRALRWMRHPASRLVRIPAGLLLILGGVFSILPGLGIWMLPLGLLLIASDVPFLRKPVGRFTIWGAERWAAFRQWLRQRRGL